MASGVGGMVPTALKCADEADTDNMEEKVLTCGKAYIAPPKGILLPVVVFEVDFTFEGDVDFAFVVDLVSTGHEGGHQWGWLSGVVRRARMAWGTGGCRHHGPWLGLFMGVGDHVSVG